MPNPKNTLIIGGAIAFLILAGLAWNYTEAIKADARAKQDAVAEQKAQATATLKAGLMKECIGKYKSLLDIENGRSAESARLMWDLSEKSCKAGTWRRDLNFDIDSIYHCEDRQLEIHGEESFVDACLKLKMSQLQ